MEDRETARMRKYGDSKTTRIMVATVAHVTSGLGLRKFQADGSLLTQVYPRQRMEVSSDLNASPCMAVPHPSIPTCTDCIEVWGRENSERKIAFLTGSRPNFASPGDTIMTELSRIPLVRVQCTAWYYTECPRRNVPDFVRVFLMLKYTDITQNTYVQSWTVTEI